MGTMVRMLCGALLVALLSGASLLWFQRFRQHPVEFLPVHDALAEESQADADPAPEDEPDPEPLAILGDDTVAATRAPGGVGDSREDRAPDAGRIWQQEDFDRLRKDIRREIASRRRTAYKELRPLEQRVFRLKNESTGLRPIEPSPHARRRVREQYERDLQAYLAANERIARELREASAERDKAAAVYAKMKEDAVRAQRCGTDELRALAADYGVDLRPEDSQP